MSASLLARKNAKLSARPICTAVVGIGYFGSLHAHSHAHLPGCRLVAVVDPDPATRPLAEHLGVAWMASIDELPSSVRAVSVATPIETHYAIARQLLERGMDVLLEKPIAETIEQAAHLRALASARGRVLQIGHIERFNPAFAAASGVIRHAHCIRARRTSERKPRSPTMDVVVDLMIHDLDLILSQRDANIVDLRATGRSHGYSLIDEAHAQFVFADGCRVELEARWGPTGEGSGHRQMIVELADGTWTLDFRQRQTSRSGIDGTLAIADAARSATGDELTAQLSAFLDAVRMRSVPLVTSEDGHMALELAHRIRRQILALPA